MFPVNLAGQGWMIAGVGPVWCCVAATILIIKKNIYKHNESVCFAQGSLYPLFTHYYKECIGYIINHVIM